MGIQNLLRFLKPFIKPVHIKKYSGKRVGIDAYSWLHKGAYSCSMELCVDSKSNAAKRYLKYFMHHINLLRHYKITPVVVFDGGNIPCKADTENERHRRREANLELAKEKLKEGNVGAAIEFFQKAVHITPTMAHQLIQILRSESVEFIVAPYEADAQLAYLSNLDSAQGGIEAVITEDSDLIAYGCKAVIFKMDRHGNGEEFLMENIFNTVSGELSFRHFDKELFTGMCILAGCDFLPSVPGIGTKRAHSLVSKYRNLDRALSALKFDKRYQVPEDYSESFRKAAAVFHHARIYDAKTKSLKPLKPLEEEDVQSLDGDLDLLGPELPSSIAAAIAEGHLNPITMEAFNHYQEAEPCFRSLDIPTFDHQSRDEPQIASTQEGCFTIFSVHESSNEKIEATEKIILDEEKYAKDAIALGKLLAPLEHQPVVKQEVHTTELPNNNPFKRRKIDSCNSEERVSEQCLKEVVATGKLVASQKCDQAVKCERDTRELPNNNPFKRRKLYSYNSEERVAEQCTKEVVATGKLPNNKCNHAVKCKEDGRELPNNNPFKRKLESSSSEERENCSEQVSVLTTVEGSFDMISSSPESQASVESKPNKKVPSAKDKLPKKSKFKNDHRVEKSEGTGILKFFQRL